MSKTWWTQLSRKRRNIEAQWRRFGILGATIKRYNQLLKHQDGVCAICGRLSLDGKKLALDHNHETGEIRGLLCFSCNYRLGVLELLIKEGNLARCYQYLESVPPPPPLPDDNGFVRPVVAERRSRAVDRVVTLQCDAPERRLRDIIAEVAAEEGLSPKTVLRYVIQLQDPRLQQY